MAAVINGISFGVLVLSLYPLAKSFFPDPYQATTVVQVAAGMTRSNESSFSTGGNQPGIGVFDGNGQRIGFLSGTRKEKIQDGRWADIAVSPIDGGNNREPEYLSVSAGGDDALCISYIAVTTPSGSNFQFYGDVPKQCGAPWYHSNSYVTLQQSYTYYPSCFWIASPRMDGTTVNDFSQGIAYRIIDFAAGNRARAAQYVDHQETLCNSAPRYKMYKTLTEMNCIPFYDPPIQPGPDFADADLNALKTDGKVACTPGPNEKVPVNQIVQLQKWAVSRAGSFPTYGVKRRAAEPENPTGQPPAGHQVIVISEHDAHSATELCKSISSVGPDFVSTKENLYCDMTARELWPVCGDKATQGCFDRNTTAMRPGTGPHARDELSGRAVPVKEYTKVTVWN